MRLVLAVLALLVAPGAALSQQKPPTAAPPQTPAPPGALKPEPAAPVSTSASRTFTAPVGMIFNAVRPERVADFEKVLGYVQAALSSSTDPTVRAQAPGWRVLKASEPGPNGAVLYVFVLDPTVMGVDYGLGHILADAYPDLTKLQEIWKLYTDSLASGGSLLNLMPFQPTAPTATESQPERK